MMLNFRVLTQVFFQRDSNREKAFPKLAEITFTMFNRVIQKQ